MLWDYLMLLTDKLIGHLVSVRMVAFMAVGALFVLVHFVVLTALFRTMSVSFTYSQTAAAIVAMTGNFALNNALTYRDIRLRRWGWVKGWVSFILSVRLPTSASRPICSPTRLSGY